MNAETIKSFLVSLGLSIDDEGMQKFANALLSASQIIIDLDRAADGITRSVFALTTSDSGGVEERVVLSRQSDMPDAVALARYPMDAVGRLGQRMVQRYPAIEQGMAKVIQNLAQTAAQDSLHPQASAGAIAAAPLLNALLPTTWAPLVSKAQRAMQWVSDGLFAPEDAINVTLAGTDEAGQTPPTASSQASGEKDVAVSGERRATRSTSSRLASHASLALREEATRTGWMQPSLSRLEQLYRLPEEAIRQVSTAMLFDVQDTPADAVTAAWQDVKPDTTRTVQQTAKKGFDPLKSVSVATRYIDRLLSGGGVSNMLKPSNLEMGSVERYGATLFSDNARDYVPRLDGKMSVAAPTLNQQTTVNVYGVSSPQEAADTVAGRQQSIMSNSIQQLITGPR